MNDNQTPNTPEWNTRPLSEDNVEGSVTLPAGQHTIIITPDGQQYRVEDVCYIQITRKAGLGTFEHSRSTHAISEEDAHKRIEVMRGFHPEYEYEVVKVPVVIPIV